MAIVSIEKFVNDVTEELHERNVAIFAGAGLSVDAGFVDWKGLLKPLAEGERFRKIWAGEWQVMFEKAHAGLQLAAKETEHIAKPDPVMAALMARGVSSNTAGEMVKRYPAERIQSQLEIFDWLVARKDPKLARNPAGFLVTSIKSDYAAPREFADALGGALPDSAAVLSSCPNWAARLAPLDRRRHDDALRQRERPQLDIPIKIIVFP